MKRKIINLLDILLFGARTDDNRPASFRRRTLRRSLFTTMLLITVIPLIITLGLSFYQYRSLLDEETTINTRWSAESARQAIEAFLGRLQAAILVISDAYTFQELTSQQSLDKVFSQLKNEQPGLVDLSVIGSDGIQRAYVGPYDLKGKDYSDQAWFNRALTSRIYVSEVFLGFRKVPHFVVVVSKKSGDDTWLLRASINSETLDRFLASVNSDLIEDVFLVDRKGAVQTSSRHGRPMFQQIDMHGGISTGSGINLSYVKQDEKQIIRASGPIKGTPWVLVLEQQDYVDRKHWLSFTSQLLLTVLLCVLLSGLVIIRVAGFLARRIVEAEQTMESALSQSEHTNRLASIGRLAAGVAHEINNPLAIINERSGLLSDMLEMTEDFPKKERFAKHLASLQKAVVRARDITHRLLGFSRRLEHKQELVAMNEVILEVLSFIEKDALYRNVKIALSLDDRLPRVMGDVGQLQQVLLNIINNAMDEVPEFGCIEVETCAKDGQLLTRISDNGKGMTEEVLQRIFEPFFTTKVTKDKRGTGLGLFITYGIVKKLGGDIRVESEQGKGTTFYISFPMDEGTTGGLG